jgi:hypothetical protein
MTALTILVAALWRLGREDEARAAPPGSFGGMANFPSPGGPGVSLIADPKAWLT